MIQNIDSSSLQRLESSPFPADLKLPYAQGGLGYARARDPSVYHQPTPGSLILAHTIHPPVDQTHGLS
jgi:hypothetical protein